MPDCDGAGMAERSYPTSEVEGGSREEIPHTLKPEDRDGGREELPHPPKPRPGVVAGRTNPTSKKPWLHRRKRA